MTAPAQTHPAQAATLERRRDVQVGLLFAAAVITALGTMAVVLLFPPAGENAQIVNDVLDNWRNVAPCGN